MRECGRRLCREFSRLATPDRAGLASGAIAGHRPALAIIPRPASHPGGVGAGRSSAVITSITAAASATIAKPSM
jgi:hypothetical protein